jgi:5-amino-6-(5-phosphoribosylamino)uracil reductase
VNDRPYTPLSCGMSIDGYLATASERRLLCSNDADFDRVDAVRAASDAILVGRRHHPERQPAAPGARQGAGRKGRPWFATDQGDGDRSCATGRVRELLRRR